MELKHIPYKLAGQTPYTLKDTQTCKYKMGTLKGETFKEYTSNQLTSFLKGMSKNMMRKFNFVNIASGVLRDVTKATLNAAYEVNAR